MKSLKLIRCTLALIAIFLGTCSGGSHQTQFMVGGWKAAPPAERRKMAEDFLKKYDTKGFTVEEIKDLLGEPDYVDDWWSYDISIRGSGSPETGPDSKAFEDLELRVFFREGIVSDVGLNHPLGLDEDTRFDAAQWKASKPAQRMKMTANLMNNRILENQTKQATQQILGDADRKPNNVEMGYDLGPRILDNLYLVFVLGSDRKILAAKIVEH